MKIDPKYIGKVCERIPVNEYLLTREWEKHGFSALFKEMLAVCWHGEKKVAVGLAANQLGMNKRIIVVDYAGFRGGMINPVITKFRGGTCTAEEGCLSFKGKKAYPIRHKIVVVEYHNEEGHLERGKYRGLLARIIQHEIDHLDGITMMDREKIGVAK